MWVDSSMRACSARVANTSAAARRGCSSGVLRIDVERVADVEINWANVAVAAEIEPVDRYRSVSSSWSVRARRVRRANPTRPTVELDSATVDVLRQWQMRLDRDVLPNGTEDRMFCNPSGCFLNPQSVTQLFDRIVRSTYLPRIRFQNLRHAHASLLVASGESIKVVSERLGHAHPAFTILTYQHLLPGMSAAAIDRFTTRRGRQPPTSPTRVQLLSLNVGLAGAVTEMPPPRDWAHELPDAGPPLESM